MIVCSLLRISTSLKCNLFSKHTVDDTRSEYSEQEIIVMYEVLQMRDLCDFVFKPNL